MTGRHAAPRPTRTGPWQPGVVALVGALGLVGGFGTQAYWNDQATVTGATVTSGSLDLLVDGVQGNPSTYTWSSLSMTDMSPGESKAGTVTLSNAVDGVLAAYLVRNVSSRDRLLGEVSTC